uniref:Uncharacterized protein n=1 Tax=Mycena chlorophos TaxID=658473 RepID=A0ABQ0LLG7_MYCCL|nr:predicted protein [Mycena chlorophos]
MCWTLEFLAPLGEDDEEPDDNALVFMFSSLAKHGSLLAVRWYSYSTTDYGFREPVWEAIAQNHKSLRVLELCAMAGEEQEDWVFR